MGIWEIAAIIVGGLSVVFSASSIIRSFYTYRKIIREESYEERTRDIFISVMYMVGIERYIMDPDVYFDSYIGKGRRKSFFLLTIACIFFLICFFCLCLFWIDFPDNV